MMSSSVSSVTGSALSGGGEGGASLDAPSPASGVVPDESSMRHSEECVMKAISMLGVNDVDGAVAQLREALKACGTTVAALLLLRMVYMCDPARFRDDDRENTPDVLQQRVDEAPDAMYARTEALLARHDARGLAWSVLRGVWNAYVLGKHDEALRYYQAALEIAPSGWEAELIKSVAYTNAAACIERITQEQQKQAKKSPGQQQQASTCLSELFPEGPKQVEETVRTWYRTAAEHGNRTAALNVAFLQLNGAWGVAADEGAAARGFQKLAEEGMAVAQMNYAWCLQTGTGCGRADIAEAALWLQRAAEQRHVPAMRKFGEFLRDGRGVPQDDKQAVVWLERAAKRGDAQAQYDLALMYQSGRGVAQQDDCEAAVLLHLAADQHLPRAAFCLANCYAKGTGVPVNAANALALFVQAAEDGLPEAMTMAGMLIMNGYGTQKDVQKGREWLTKAAALNEPNALSMLAKQAP